MTPEQELIIKQFAMSSARPTSHLIEYVNSIIAAEVEKEREACARQCDSFVGSDTRAANGESPFHDGIDFASKRCAAAIRARSKP